MGFMTNVHNATSEFQLDVSNIGALEMAKNAPKHSRDAAARACASRHAPKTTPNGNSTLADSETNITWASPPLNVDSEPESECGYKGGVAEFLPEEICSDDEYITSDSNWLDSSNGMLSDWDEESLAALREEVISLTVDTDKQTMFDKLQDRQKNWKKIDKNRSLGYNGISEQTQYRHQAEVHQ